MNYSTSIMCRDIHVWSNEVQFCIAFAENDLPYSHSATLLTVTYVTFLPGTHHTKIGFSMEKMHPLKDTNMLE